MKSQKYHTYTLLVAQHYILVNELQMKRKIDKWKPRCRVGIYLGLSPSHANSMHLIMSPATGQVSPQFHVTFDYFFETIKQETQRIQYGWQSKAGLSPQKKSVTFHDQIANAANNVKRYCDSSTNGKCADTKKSKSTENCEAEKWGSTNTQTTVNFDDVSGDNIEVEYDKKVSFDNVHELV